MTQHSNAKGVAWVALVISLIALVFAWIAFNETGPNLDERVESEVQQVLETRQAPQESTSTETGTTSTSSQAEGEPDADETTTTDQG